jgi:hypothetical protein
MAERRFPNPTVGGSNPSSPAKFIHSNNMIIKCINDKFC